jgi:hypothetical protein
MKNITCMCENNFDADIADNIELDNNPEIVASILDGSFMNITCPKCKKVLKPEFPLTITDHGKNWEIIFIPELQRQEYLKTVKQAKGAGITRLVIGYPELLEKIKILTADLDDRIIEYLKYFIFSKILEKTENNENEIFLYYNGKEGNELVFHIRGLKNDEVGIFKISYSTYTKAVPEIEKKMSEEPFNEFLIPPYVSLNRLYSWSDL